MCEDLLTEISDKATNRYTMILDSLLQLGKRGVEGRESEREIKRGRGREGENEKREREKDQ